MRIDLQLTGMHEHGVSGWAYCPEDLSRRPWLELLADGFAVGIARAENAHAQASAVGDGCYGFWLPLPPVLLDQRVVFQIRPANSITVLAQWDQDPATATPQQDAALGQLWHDGGLTLSGWIVDNAAPDRAVCVDAWHEEKKVASVLACGRRFQPAASDGHGFQLDLPLWMADGRSRLVDLRHADGRPLPGSPVRVCAFARGPAQWLRAHKPRLGLNCEQAQLLLQYLDHMGPRLPQSVALHHADAWLRAFPSEINASVPPVVKNTADADASHILLLPPNTSMLPQGLALLRAAAQSGKAALVYGDGLWQGPHGLMPICKPAWDAQLFYTQDYLGPVLVSAELHRQAIEHTAYVANLPAHHEGDQGITRLLAILLAGDAIAHLPVPVYERSHWPGADDLHASMVQQHLRQHSLPNVLPNVPPTLSQDAQAPELRVEVLPQGYARVHYPLPRRPLVSVIIPTRDRADLLEVCLRSLQSTTHAPMEICIVDNASTEAATLALLDKAKAQGMRVLSWPGAFNYAAIHNFAASEAKGEFLCFLNNDTEIRSPQWLDEMLSLALLPKVGCVGAKLQWPNGLVQHGGVVLGVHQLAGHVGNQWTVDEPGYMGRNLCVQQYSAVTAACMLTPRALFLESGGFDALRFPVAFNDVDYCLRLRAQGLRVLWTPHVDILHHESASRGKDVTSMNAARAAMESEHFRQQWGRYEDPFYNPNLALSTVCEPFCGLALPPRQRSVR